MIFYISRIVFSWFCAAILFFLTTGLARSEETFSAGFLFDQFKLTLENGQRTEAAGPFFYSEKNESGQTLAVPPFFSSYKNSAVDSGEFDFLYPLLTCEHYGGEWRWQLGELLSFAGGRQPDDFQTHQFTIFPFYFQQRSLDTNLNYTAVVPFLSLIHISEPTRQAEISYAVF